MLLSSLAWAFSLGCCGWLGMGDYLAEQTVELVELIRADGQIQSSPHPLTKKGEALIDSRTEECYVMHYSWKLALMR